METFLLLSTNALPCLVYLTMGAYTAVRQRKTADIGEDALRGFPGEVTAVLFIIAAGYLIGCFQTLLGDPSGLEGVMDRTVFKVYVISSVLPFLLVRRVMYSTLPGVYLYVPALSVILLALIPDILVLTGSGSLPYPLVGRIAVTVNLLIFVFCVSRTSVYSRKRDKRDAAGGRYVQELQFHITVLSVYNFLYLFYSFGQHYLVCYFVLTAAFATIHAVISLAWSDGTGVVTAFAFLSGPQDMSAEPEEYGSGPEQTPPVLEDAPHGAEYIAETGYDAVRPLRERLMSYFENEKPYLSKDITMEEVAMRLYTNKSYLSKTINVEMNKNFRELVNYFRVKEAVRIFSDNMDISMNELREKCGFNNNASFTSAFKLNTGFTPGEWCRDMRNKRYQAMGIQK